jgi:hypothetical protein
VIRSAAERSATETLTWFAGLWWQALRDPRFHFLVGSQVLIALVPVFVQWWLLSRMAPERRARAWNSLTWACANLWVQAAGMIPFAWVSRRERGAREAALAIAYGIALAVAVLLVQLGLAKGLELLGGALKLEAGQGP